MPCSLNILVHISFPVTYVKEITTVVWEILRLFLIRERIREIKTTLSTTELLKSKDKPAMQLWRPATPCFSWWLLLHLQAKAGACHRQGRCRSSANSLRTRETERMVLRGGRNRARGVFDRRWRQREVMQHHSRLHLLLRVHHKRRHAFKRHECAHRPPAFGFWEQALLLTASGFCVSLPSQANNHFRRKQNNTKHQKRESNLIQRNCHQNSSYPPYLFCDAIIILIVIHCSPQLCGTHPAGLVLALWFQLHPSLLTALTVNGIVLFAGTSESLASAPLKLLLQPIYYCSSKKISVES